MFELRNPFPLPGIPDDDTSRQQLRVALDDLARTENVNQARQRMQEVAGNFAPWLNAADLEEWITDSLRARRRWDSPDEIRELAELFKLSEADRDELRIRQIRPLRPDGSAHDDASWKARDRARRTLWESEKRKRKAAAAVETSDQSTDVPAGLSKLSQLIFDKIDGKLRSTTAVAKAIRRSHGYEGTREIPSIRKTVIRAAAKFQSAGFVEIVDGKGANGQPLKFVRRLLVHVNSVSETSRHVEIEP